MFNHICGCSCSYCSFHFFPLIFSQPLIFPCVMQLFVIHDFFSAPKFFRSPLPSLALKSNVSFKHICGRSFLCLISCVSCSRSVYFFICPLNTCPMPLIVEGMETSFLGFANVSLNATSCSQSRAEKGLRHSRDRSIFPANQRRGLTKYNKDGGQALC